MKINVVDISGGAEAVEVLDLRQYDIVAHFANWNLIATPDAPEIDEDTPDWSDIEDEVVTV
jgi:hypothetical protein